MHVAVREHDMQRLTLSPSPVYMAAGGIVLITFYARVRQSFYSNGRPPKLLGKCGELLMYWFCLHFVLRSVFVLLWLAMIPSTVWFSVLVPYLPSSYRMS